ncbi:MAG: hypothetical protein ACE5K8_02835 [Candidatus Zixiibacteriota bacterium]
MIYRNLVRVSFDTTEAQVSGGIKTRRGEYGSPSRVFLRKAPICCPASRRTSTPAGQLIRNK